MKLVGCITVIVFSFFIGVCFSERERESLEVCTEIYDFIKKLQSEIEKRVPLGDIISKYNSEYHPKHLKGSSRAEMLECLSELEKGCECKGCAVMCSELVASIGKSPDGRYNTEKCSDTAEAVLAVLDEKKINHKSKCSMYPKLGAIAGIFVCIILA